MYKCFLVILPVLAASIQVCPDKWALHNVSAWRSSTTSSKSEYDEYVNFNTLDGYAVIHVVKANVSVLCEGMIKDFRRLEKLILTEANIYKIMSNAFQQLPSLTSLSLAVNHLTGVHKSDFKNLDKLTVLYLSSNEIDEIESGAFSELVNLQKIYLDKNLIAEIDGKWFLNNPKISLINLAFNKISVLQAEAFTLPKNSAVEIRLQRNIIERVEEGAVVSRGTDQEKPYLTLHLDHNRLTDVSVDFIRSMDTLHSTLYFNFNNFTCVPLEVLKTLKDVSVDLYLLENPLSCKCVKNNIIEFLKTNFLKATFQYNFANECYLYGVPTPREWEQQRMY